MDLDNVSKTTPQVTSSVFVHADVTILSLSVFVCKSNTDGFSTLFTYICKKKCLKMRPKYLVEKEDKNIFVNVYL